MSDQIDPGTQTAPAEEAESATAETEQQPAPEEEQAQEPKEQPAEEAEPAPAAEPAAAPPVVDELKAQRAKRQEAERRAAFLEGQLAQQNAQTQPAPKADPNAPPVQPKLEDFEDFSEYEAAKDKYLEDRAVYRIRQEDAQRREQERIDKTMAAYNASEKAVTADIPDYLETIRDSKVMLPEVALVAIMESTVGPRIKYHFAKNPEEAERFKGMSPTSVVKEIGRLEMVLTPKSAPTTAPAPVKKASEAPAPLPAGRGSSTAPKSPQEMSTAEYIKWRNDQEWGPRRT